MKWIFDFSSSGHKLFENQFLIEIVPDSKINLVCIVVTDDFLCWLIKKSHDFFFYQSKRCASKRCLQDANAIIVVIIMLLL